jgi:hypothetical protein
MMNHIKWAAWGVVDIEKLDRIQRRNYIKRSRKELEEIRCSLNCGGSTQTPYYQIILPTTDNKTIPKHAAGGLDAFKKVCEWLLKEIGDADGNPSVEAVEH